MRFQATLAQASGFHTPLSPGVVVVHDDSAPLFAPGERDRGLGIEQLAEDGDAGPLLDALAANPPPGAKAIVTFDTPIRASAQGPAIPGDAFVVTVRSATPCRRHRPTRVRSRASSPMR